MVVFINKKERRSKYLYINLTFIILTAIQIPDRSGF